jgi:hypothetical protein
MSSARDRGKARMARLARLERRKAELTLELSKIAAEEAKIYDEFAYDARVVDAPALLVDVVGREAPATSGVYAVQGYGDFVKIGRAKNIRERLLGLQGANPVPLKLLAVLSTNPEDEFVFHERFSDYRTIGEWFRLEGELKEFLGMTTETMQ